ncbi:MAG TPA: outer membrane protein assembly factor BamD [Kiritimatiellia bacterium]|nr:outer membrane protein assembly factor BamD [Kiritimatiellia bacterium]
MPKPVSIPILLLLASAASLFTLAPAASASPEYVEAGKQHSWFSLSRPARDNPDDQLDHANQLRERGRIRKARRQFNALATTWPGTPQAAAALYAKARIEEDRGNPQAAFDAYQRLMENYAGRIPYHEILNRQFELAREVMDKRRAQFLFLPGFQAPERAIPLLENVIRNGPRSPHAAEAQYLIGRAYEESNDYELAIVAYLVVQHRHPASPFAEKAAFARTRTLQKLSSSQPNDNRTLNEAVAAANLFLNAYPRSEYRDDVLNIRNSLVHRQARNAFDIARFYDRHTRRPAAALANYQEFLRQFPTSSYAPKAQQRVTELSRTVTLEEPDETLQ